MKPTDFRPMLDNAAAEARAIDNEINVLASLLAEKMRCAHGDDYRVQIDHQNKFVMVVARLRK